MATTTPQLIREKQRDLIKAIVPTQFANCLFVEHVAKGTFREWVDLNAATCLRTFAIEDLSGYATPLGGDSQSEEVVTQFAVSVAYPVDYAYGEDGVNGLSDAVYNDHLAIDRAIGIYGVDNYVAGQNGAWLQPEIAIERGEKAWLATAIYDINFRRAV